MYTIHSASTSIINQNRLYNYYIWTTTEEWFEQILFTVPKNQVLILSLSLYSKFYTARYIPE